ncbi:hypothetical protein DFJ63DRAFT_311351 [Scheffersomyces coipomensis]|uniref:uncharacterized protein n=1 Tax=Scheffersomyces coipomensis TaxID=1788519 RepID=UPI00315C5974
MITTGFLFGSGDMLAQTLFKSPISNVDGSSESFDYSRFLRAVVYGSIIFAPIGDKWYKLLNKIKFPTKALTKGKEGLNKELPQFKEHVLPIKQKPSVKDTLLRVSFDQLIFAPFIGIPLYYSMMTIFENLESTFTNTSITTDDSILNVIIHKMNENWWNTLRSNWLIWPIFQLFNFYLIPVQYRLLVVNSLSIGWNCYLSYVLNRKDLLMIQGGGGEGGPGGSIIEASVNDDGMVY